MPIILLLLVISAFMAFGLWGGLFAIIALLMLVGR